MSRTVKELLSDPLKGTNRAQGVLCYLFRHVLLWRRVNQFTWNKRAKLFFEKPHNREKADMGNLNKTLTADDFTWKSFKKSIDFLNPAEAVLEVHLTWKSGVVSKYAIKIDPTEEDDEIETEWEDAPESDVFQKLKKPANTLARLFRHIVAGEQVDMTRWNALLEEYVSNPHRGAYQNRREMVTTISTLQRELLEPTMTWNRFRKGILVLGPVQEDYLLKLRWSKDPNDLSLHQVTIRDPLTITKKSD